MRAGKVFWWERPDPKVKDGRDAEEHADVAAALEKLHADHPARRAYADGAGTIELTHLVGLAYPDVLDALKEAILAGYRRLAIRGPQGFRP